MTFGFGGGYDFRNVDGDPGDRFLARLLARKPSEDEDAEAQVRWGKASSFVQQLKGEKILPTIQIVNWPDFPGNDKDDEEEPVIDWQELARTTSNVRVENPDDSDQYVIVQRVETITFQTPEGKRIRLNFKNEEAS
ncbi:hypothetical protein ELH48_13630 [Rhizobium ruizarguesonis]|uniref:hypothetical protein n=1 Tax=Rhizobium ruizarguesonis TaxID=2081791 RepID=UPI00102F89AF|nr:hypothetical protein [Rhizobium ruizarguesonis]TBB28120.1 hypothetical protein ELH48_13630 [Rhizobium ruizarguesonis]TBB49737.1 hypothetical protein ELH46_13625 [Rhizobium ruizarguesonis]